MSGRELAKRVGLPFLMVLFVAAPFIFNDPYYQHLLILICVWSMLALGFLLILTTGQFTLGHAGYMAIGAYASALMTTKLGWSFWAALPASAVIAAIFGLLTGWIMLRARMGAFLLMTLCFAEVVRLAIVYWPSVLGGSAGIPNIPRPDSIAGMAFDSKFPYYYLILFLLAVMIYVIYRMDRSKFGLIFKSIGQNTPLAQSVGVNPMRYKILAYTLACFFAGVAGSFYAHYLTFLSPEYFTVWKSLMIQMYAIIGGIGFMIAGPIAGSVFLVVIPELLRATENLSLILYGAVFILVIFFCPGGLLSLPQQMQVWRHALRRRAMILGGSGVWQYLRPGS